MAFPKKQTHTIVVAGETYLWHRSKRFEAQNRWTVVQKRGTAGQLLMFDPYHYDLSLGAGAVRHAIEFALAHGWTPDRPAHPMKLRYNGAEFPGEAFTVLPPDARIADNEGEEHA
jgi:hypothetical protein